MDKVKNRFKSFLALALLLSLVYAAGCAEVRLHTIPAPPPTAKLRVYIQAFTSPENVHWKIPHPVFEKNIMRGTTKVLQGKGIYEVISQDDIKMALGGRQARMKKDWSRKNWALAREVGRAVHAEYALFVSRTKLVENQNTGTVFNEMILVNTETGKKFRVVGQAPARWYIGVEEYKRMSRTFHRELFRNAKEDMLATAIRKGRLERATPSEMTSRPALPPLSAVPTETKSSVPIPPAKSSPLEKPAVVAKPGTPKSPPPPGIPSSSSPDPSSSFTAESRVDLEKTLRAEIQVEGRRRLAVYDLEAVEQYKVVALILSEALREELLRLDHFQLVNRENIVKVLGEMALQQTGMVDEKEAIKAGKGLAVQQIVLGRYGALGKVSILQAKRLDVETQGALGMGSLKCDFGREEELLQHMAELARKITGNK
jgi:hypothetical protein